MHSCTFDAHNVVIVPTSIAAAWHRRQLSSSHGRARAHRARAGCGPGRAPRARGGRGEEAAGGQAVRHRGRPGRGARRSTNSARFRTALVPFGPTASRSRFDGKQYRVCGAVIATTRPTQGPLACPQYFGTLCALHGLHLLPDQIGLPRGRSGGRIPPQRGS